MIVVGVDGWRGAFEFGEDQAVDADLELLEELGGGWAPCWDYRGYRRRRWR